MNQEKDSIQKEYEGFLQDALNHKEVWILDSEEGMACQSSLEYEDRMAILFWSNGILAEIERNNEFENLEAHTLPLFELLFQWLPNMQEEGVICGLNWNQENGGLEVEPQDLLDHFNMIIPEDMEAEFQEKLSSLDS